MLFSVLFYVPLGLFVVLILANIFAEYVSWKAACICLALFVASFFLPAPAPTVVATLLDIGLLMKFKLEYF